MSPIFPSHQSEQAGLVSQVTISPDGTRAAGIVTSSSGAGTPQDGLIEQALPSGAEIITPIPGSTVLGWTSGDGVLLEQNFVDAADRYYTGFLIWVALAGASEAQLVETINVTSQTGRPITFAPVSPL